MVSLLAILASCRSPGTIGAAVNRFYELVRYGIVGVINASSYLALYTALVLLGVPYVLAAVVAFPIPVAFGYWLHERWTFARNEPTMRRLAVFLALQIMAFGAGLGLLVLLVNGVGVDPILARVIVTPVPTLLAYLGTRIFVFAQPTSGARLVVRDAAPEPSGSSGGWDTV
jgi:putative flippase GtrA